jgi:hypothetical protein
MGVALLCIRLPPFSNPESDAVITIDLSMLHPTLYRRGDAGPDPGILDSGVVKATTTPTTNYQPDGCHGIHGLLAHKDKRTTSKVRTLMYNLVRGTAKDAARHRGGE